MLCLHCGEQLAAEHGVPPLSMQPMLLSTDLNLMRRFVAGGQFKRLVTRNITVIHGAAECVHAGLSSLTE